MRTQHTGEGGFSDKAIRKKGVEDIRCSARDTDCIAEYLFGAGGGFGGGTSITAAGECQGGNTTLDKSYRQDPHGQRRGLLGMGNVGE